MTSQPRVYLPHSDRYCAWPPKSQHFICTPPRRTSCAVWERERERGESVGVNFKKELNPVITEKDKRKKPWHQDRLLEQFRQECLPPELKVMSIFQRFQGRPKQSLYSLNKSLRAFFEGVAPSKLIKALSLSELSVTERILFFYGLIFIKKKTQSMAKKGQYHGRSLLVRGQCLEISDFFDVFLFPFLLWLSHKRHHKIIRKSAPESYILSKQRSSIFRHDAQTQALEVHDTEGKTGTYYLN